MKEWVSSIARGGCIGARGSGTKICVMSRKCDRLSVRRKGERKIRRESKRHLQERRQLLRPRHWNRREVKIVIE